MIQKLRKIEDDYMELFCKKESLGELDFFSNGIKEMFDHNFILVKEISDETTLKTAILDQLKLIRRKEQDFLKVVFHPAITLSPEFLDWATQTGFQTSKILYMARSVIPDLNLDVGSNCVVKRAESVVEIQKGLDCAAKFESGRMPSEILTRKLKEKERAYLERSILLYICYVDGYPVGYGDWFQKNGIVKLEELVILDEYQRKGYGTALLRKMIADAVKGNFHLVYLVTYEEDDAKNLYHKIGFQRVGKETELFYNFLKLNPRL